MEDKEAIEQELSRMWQMVPPAEKHQLLTQAQSHGVEACILFLVLTGAAAFSLQLPWLLLGLAAFLPVFYQTTAARLWRELKPRITAQYFLASQAAKHFAMRNGCDDINLAMIFRATTGPAPIPDANHSESLVPEGEQEESANLIGNEVWISLFTNSLFMVRESDSGAVLECGLESLEDVSITLDFDEEELSSPRLRIQKQTPEGAPLEWILYSKYSDTLRACENRFHALRGHIRSQPPILEISESN
jgi:hypothetical protein